MKHYQIVVKGIFTNKIDLYEFNSCENYLETIRQIKEKYEYLQIITTNIY